MDVRDLREIMGLTQAQVADELGVPRQEVVDCEENGETYLLLQYISAFPINPQIMKDPDVDPFLPSFDQTSPGDRMRRWREEHGISRADMADAVGVTEEALEKFETGEGAPISRRRGEEIEKKTGLNRKWLMYGDGRDQGTPKLQPVSAENAERAEENEGRDGKPQAPNREAGDRIRQARKDAGLSREKLAELLDLSVSRVAQMENGYVKDEKAESVLQRIAEQQAGDRESPKAAGVRLRAARNAAGLTVREAAEVVGLKPSTLAHLESGYVSGKRADELIAEIRRAPAKKTSEFDAKEAGVRIREARTAAGLSQKELATIMRMPVTRISLMELGTVTRQESEDVLRRIEGKPSREIVQKRVKRTNQVLLGSGIRDARMAAGLSQKELGDLLEVPQTRISLMERGKVDQATADRVLRVLADRQEELRAATAKGMKLPAPEERNQGNPELGQRISEARRAAGLSQKELAAMLGLSQGSVSYMEQGRVNEENAERVLQMIRERQTEPEEQK